MYNEVRVDSSIALQLHCVGKSTPVDIRQDGDEKVWSLKQTDPKPIDALWDYMPSDQSAISYVTYCTGESWSDIAEYYHEMVNQQIAGEVLGVLPDEVKRSWQQEHDPSDRLKLVEAACTKILQSIRYTGIEFGVAAIQPARPIDTMRRRYGDCKDQACLMVAVLRELDMEAYVALLNTQTATDLVAEAPGLNAFDHAMVYLPTQEGLNETWIDMTASFTTFGELPVSDQGRLALVAAPSTKDLKRISQTKSRDNFRRHKTVYQLATDGPATATVTTSSRGSFASYWRSAYASQPSNQLRRSLEDQYRDVYGDANVEQFQYDDPTNISSPDFKVQYNLTSENLTTNEAGILTVELQPGGAFGYLPYEFVGPEYAALIADPEDIERSLPFEISRYVFQTEVELHPPVGFDVVSLPKPKTIHVGDLKVELTCKEQTDRTIQFQIQLDTGDGNLSQDQMVEFRDEFLSLSGNVNPDEWSIPIEFAYEPTRTFEEGDEVAGIRAMIQIAKDNPKDLFNRGELSNTLLLVGLVRESQAVAKQMVADAPESTIAHWQLAWSNMHNLQGQSLRRGVDHALVIANLQRLIELDPDNLDAKYNLAVALEHDDQFNRHTNQEALEKSATLYKKLLEEVPFEQAVVNYALVLMNLGETRSIRNLTRSYPTMFEPWIFLAVAEILDNGLAAGNRVIAQASQRFDKNMLQENIVAQLRSLRRYDLLREFVNAHPGISNASSFIANLKPYEDVKLDSSDPSSALQSMLAKFMTFGADMDKLRKSYIDTDDQRLIAADVRGLPVFLQNVRTGIIENFGRTDLCEDILSMYEFSAEGDDVGGYLVSATVIDGIAESVPSVGRMAVRDGEHYRIHHSGRSWNNYGVKALELIDSGHPEEAKRWIDPVYDFERNQVSFFDPFAGSPFGQSWFASSASDTQDLRLAALLLASRNSDDTGIDEQLVAVRDQYRPALQLQIDRARITCLNQQKRFEDSLSLAETLLERYPNKTALLAARFEAELALGYHDKAESTLKRISSVDVRNSISPRHRFLTKTQGHRKAMEYIRERYEEHPEMFLLRDKLCWRSLFTGESSQFLEQARQSVAESLTMRHVSANGHTLACIYADNGQLTKAVEELTEAVNARNGIHESYDQLVLGRIAQQCGLPEAAAKYYQQVEPPLFGEVPNASCFDLAKKWMQSLDSTDEQ
ncbi:hypothetical protein [Rhodopirellula bahusiensis]